MPFHTPDSYSEMGFTVSFLVPAALTDDRYTLIDYTMPPGFGGPGLHRHSTNESIYVLEGSIGVHLDGVEHVLGPGEAAHIGCDEPHSFWNAGDEPARCLFVGDRRLADDVGRDREPRLRLACSRRTTSRSRSVGSNAATASNSSGRPRGCAACAPTRRLGGDGSLAGGAAGDRRGPPAARAVGCPSAADTRSHHAAAHGLRRMPARRLRAPVLGPGPDDGAGLRGS